MATVPNAVELKDIQADVKILLEKKATSGGEGRPMSFEINRLHVGEINAQGITVVRLDELGAENDDAKAKPVKKTMQVVTLPKNDKVSIKDINVSGLRVTLAEEGPALSTIGADASISVGQTDLSGIGYSEKTAKGSVLKAFSLDRGKFEELKLQALGRNGRQYSMDEFFKFFGSTQLAGLDAAASFKEGKTSGKIEVKGQKNRPISALYNVGENRDPDYYSIRMPLSSISLPALHLEIEEHIINIPRAASRATTSHLNDVDVQLKVQFGKEKDGAVPYEVRVESLDVAEMEVFGLEYHNTNPLKKTEILFDKLKPFRIPSIKASGFRFSSAKSIDVFGNGGVLKAGGPGAIEANIAKISGLIKNGNFIADSFNERPAFELGISLFTFTQDSDGNKILTLEKVNGGFPNFVLNQTDPESGKISSIKISSLDKRSLVMDKFTISTDAEGKAVFEATGMKAGGMTVKYTTEEKKDPKQLCQQQWIPKHSMQTR